MQQSRVLLDFPIPKTKTVLLSKNRLHDFCYLTLFTFMRRSRTRRHMETKKVMMK